MKIIRQRIHFQIPKVERISTRNHLTQSHVIRFVFISLSSSPASLSLQREFSWCARRDYQRRLWTRLKRQWWVQSHSDQTVKDKSWAKRYLGRCSFTYTGFVNPEANWRSLRADIVVHHRELRQIKSVSEVRCDLEIFPLEETHESVWNEIEIFWWFQIYINLNQSELQFLLLAD